MTAIRGQNASCEALRHRRAMRVAGAMLLALMLAVAGSVGMGRQAQAAADKLFVVSGIPVDVTAEDATRAKMQALMQAQRQAFLRIVQRLAGQRVAARLAKLSDRDIGRLLSSLSIADEQTGPTRYIARITIRFSPRKLTRLLKARGIAFATRQAPPVLIVPLWEEQDGTPVLWEDNPWLKAWRTLADEHALVPVLVPVGDEVDRNTLSAMQAQQGDAEALQALQLRYGTEYALVAIARPVDDRTVQAAMVGRSPGGKLLFDKTYTVQQGGVEEAARVAAQRFIEVMTLKWRRKVFKRMQEEAARRAAARAARARGVTVVVPFSSLREWQQLRARLISTPGVRGVDVRSISGTHAVVKLATPLSTQALQQALSGSGLLLQQSAGQWYVRAY